MNYICQFLFIYPPHYTQKISLFFVPYFTYINFYKRIEQEQQNIVLLGAQTVRQTQQQQVYLEINAYIKSESYKNIQFKRVEKNLNKMSKKEMTLVYYYIPQDHDDQDTPNVFGVMMSKNNIRLQHLYDTFPLKGSYIFRFKVMYDNTIAWLDLPELDTKLPTFKDKIIVKATRISWQPSKNNPYGHYRFAKKQVTSSTVLPTPGVKKQQIQTPPPLSDPPIKVPKVQLPQKTQHEDLLSDKHEINNSGNTGNAGNNIPINLNLNMNLVDDHYDLLNVPANTKTSSATNIGRSPNLDIGDLI